MSAAQIEGGNIYVKNKNDINHLKNVLRAKIGDGVDISDSGSWEYATVIDEIGRDWIRLKIMDKRRFAREPSVKVALYQAIPKSGKMEDIVRKCVELGINRIVPVLCARTVAVRGDGYGARLERLRRVASEAVKQCGRGIVPEVAGVMGFCEAAGEMARHDLRFFPYENENEITIKDFLRRFIAPSYAFRGRLPDGSDSDGCFGDGSNASRIGERRDEVLSRAVGSVAFMIGPEGGFSDEEAESLKALSCWPVSLGRTILRTETAAAATLAMLMYELEL